MQSRTPRTEGQEQRTRGRVRTDTPRLPAVEVLEGRQLMAADGLSGAAVHLQTTVAPDLTESSRSSRAAKPKTHSLTVSGRLAGTTTAATAADTQIQYAFAVSGKLKGFGLASGTVNLVAASTGKRRPPPARWS